MSVKVKRIICIILCLFILATSSCVTFADEKSGWTEDKTHYFYEDGEVATGIVVINKKFYCFNQNGKYLVQKTAKIRKAAKYEKPFANLKKFIGQPNKSKYYTSCYGNGQDGVLTYDNFTIYTFKPAKGKEIFMNAE